MNARQNYALDNHCRLAGETAHPRFRYLVGLVSIVRRARRCVMAWCIVSKPGSRLGPCAGCPHKDCQELRDLAASICPGCKKPIGYEEPYTSDPFVARSAVGTAPRWHFGCAQDAVEDQVKARVSAALSPAAGLP